MSNTNENLMMLALAKAMQAQSAAGSAAAAAADAERAEAAAQEAMSGTPTGYSNIVGSIAETFSSSKAYAAGDYVLKDSVLYRFTAAHAAGAWTGSDATAVNLGDETSDLKTAITQIQSTLDYQSETINLLTNATKYSGYKLDGSGELSQISTHDTYAIDYDGSYAIFNATVRSNSTYDQKAIAFYNSSNVVISTKAFLSTSEPSVFENVAIPAGTAKIYVCSRNDYSTVVTATAEVEKSQHFTNIENDVDELRDEIALIDNELDLVDTNVNLISGATKHENYKLNSSGALESISTYDVYEIAYDGFYSMFNATVYSNSNYDLKAIAFYNAENHVISTLAYPTTTETSAFTNQAIPAGTAKIYLNTKKTIPTASCIEKQSKRLSDIEDDIADNQKGLSALQYSTKNLFDASKKTDSVLLDTSNGTTTQSSDYYTSDYIDVLPNTIYSISGYLSTGTYDITGLRIALYATDKSFISGSDGTSRLRTPATAKYIRFSLQTNKVKAQVERRSFATKYAPYNGYVVSDESDLMFMNFPSRVYAVTGLQYNWYLFNVRPDRYENEFKSRYRIVSNAKLHQYGRFLRLEENNTSTDDISITTQAESATKFGVSNFVVKIKNPSTLSTVSVLILGDSTTANGYVAQYLHEFAGTENQISTVGTLGTAPYNHEGRSGWTLNDYFTTSTDNPFYNPSTQTFDAEYYFTQTGISVPDIFIINLGINDMHYNSGTPTSAANTADEYVAKVDSVIASLKSVSNSIKVAVCLTTPPNVDPYSFGAAGVNIIGYDDYRIANLILCEKLIDAYDYRWDEGIYLIPINAVLDTKYNMPTMTGHPNSRSSLDITLPNSAANVHPNQAGYHQIADEMYAFICSLYA